MATNDLELVGQSVLKLNTIKADKTQLTAYQTAEQVDAKLVPYAKKTDIPQGQDLSEYAKLTDVTLEAQTKTQLEALIK